jgi:NAD(P)-dependent dehydrogenase (short-subunit alcohol dehydrogenase family)
MQLEGKIAIITGTTGALGEVVAKSFLQEGCTVYAPVRPGSKKSPPSGTKGVIADLTREEDVVSCFFTVAGQEGRVDIVVNTVGGFLPRKPIREISLAEWEAMMKVNLLSAFLCTREALKVMEGKPYGRIVNIAAMVGIHPSAGRAAYGISKAGVIHLTNVAAQEVKGTGITVNAIAPFIIDTPANRSSMPGEDFSQWTKPETIAASIIFLCTPAASSINGTLLKM